MELEVLMINECFHVCEAMRLRRSSETWLNALVIFFFPRKKRNYEILTVWMVVFNKWISGWTFV